MSCKVLCVGDIHLGKRPSRVPDDLPGVNLEELTPAAAWQRTVDRALAEPVDAVLLAGDVIESVQDRMAAFGSLEDGVRRLTAADIEVLGVAGNHDEMALPRLARNIPDFRLLGAGGSWESVEIGTRSGTPVRVWGWSFPRRRVEVSPLESLGRSQLADDGIATLGLLHCDLDAATGSPYAPVARAEIEAVPFHAWLLGHIHRPDKLEGPRPMGYLGALTGLNPRDQGTRGPWLLEIEGPGTIRAEHLPLAPLRYESELVSVEGINAVQSEDLLEEAVETALLGAMDRVYERLEPELDATRAVACRLELIGCTADHRRLVHAIDRLRWTELSRTFGRETTFFIEAVRDGSHQTHDLARLAGSQDPPGLLAQRLLDLEEMNERGTRLVERARVPIEQEAGDRRRWGLMPEGATLPDVRALLLTEGLKALEELLAQKHREFGVSLGSQEVEE